MTYVRVLPRDLFNEANLLKCYGQLWLLIEGMGAVSFLFDTVDEFRVEQDQNDGSLCILNLPLVIGYTSFWLTRPLNSREPWPLYAYEIGNDDFDAVAVFDTDGKLSHAMRDLIAKEG